MNRYTVIFFDLDNTLLDFYASESRAIRQVLAKHGLPNGDAEAKLYSDINRSYWEAFERGDIKKEEIFAGRFRTFLERMGLNGDPEAIAKDYFGFLADGHDLMDGAVDILEWLRKSGCKVYATTNGVALTQYKRIKDSGLEPLFDGVFVSETVGAQKPSKEYFEYVIQNTPTVDRDKILVVGDSQSSDILGGINAGLDTCWVAPSGQENKYNATFHISSLDELKSIIL